MNRVVVIMAKPLEYLPPVMSLLQTLRAGGRKPIFVGVESLAGEAFLASNGFERHYVPFDWGLYKNPTIISKITHRIQRAIRFYPRRSALRKKLRELNAEHGGITVWFAEVQSAALLGNDWRKYPNRIVTIFELADFRGSSWWGFSFKKFVKNTVVVEPEINRAREIQRYFALDEEPLVVANKPNGHPRQYNGEIPESIQALLPRIDGRPIFLYQGVWTEDRKDVGIILETIAKNRPQYAVLVMPGTPAIEKIAAKYSNLFTLPYIAPPKHLAVTSLAAVGIAVYNSAGKTELEKKNALFCAPNKIYEYAGFGLPTLGNKIPGLEDTIGRAQAGACVAIEEAEILAAADELVRNQEFYRQRANAFFDATDVVAQVKAVLERAEGK